MTINSLNNSGRIESARRVENTRNSDVLKHITDCSLITDYSFYFVRNPETGEETQQTRTYTSGQKQPLEQEPLPHIPQNSIIADYRITYYSLITDYSFYFVRNPETGEETQQTRTFTFGQEQPLEQKPLPHIPQNSTLGQRPTVNPMHSIQNIINSNVGDARPTFDQRPPPAHIPQNSTLGQRPTVNPMHSIQNIINSNVGDARPTFDQRPPPAHIPQNSTLGQRPTVNPMHSIQNIINSNVGDARPTFDQRPPPAHIPQNSTLGQEPIVPQKRRTFVPQKRTFSQVPTIIQNPQKPTTPWNVDEALTYFEEAVARIATKNPQENAYGETNTPFITKTTRSNPQKRTYERIDTLDEKNFSPFLDNPNQGDGVEYPSKKAKTIPSND